MYNTVVLVSCVKKPLCSGKVLYFYLVKQINQMKKTVSASGLVSNEVKTVVEIDFGCAYLFPVASRSVCVVTV